jgi:hypothetical protein
MWRNLSPPPFMDLNVLGGIAVENPFLAPQ